MGRFDAFAMKLLQELHVERQYPDISIICSVARGSHMPEVRVVPEDLQVSAATVDAHADSVRIKHAAADGRIESAQKGLPAGSASALGAAVAKWQTDSTAMVGRMIADSDGLRSGAASYTAADADAAAAVETAGNRIRPEDMGL